MKAALVTISLTLTAERAKEVIDFANEEAEVETKSSKKSKSKAREEEEEEENEEEEEEEKASKKSSKKSSKRKEEEEEEENEEEENEEEEEEEKSSKKGAISLDQVIASFRDYAKKNSREKAAKILKGFKADSVNDLKPSQYKEVLAKLKGK